MKLKIYKGPTSLNEIFQPAGYQFAFWNKKGEQATQWVKCKDYLQDAVRSHITKTGCRIYGFQYQHGDNPTIDIDKTRIAIKRMDTEQAKKALAIINHVEERMDLQPTVLIAETTQRAKGKPIQIFEGDANWLTTSQMISLYTFLLRLSFYEKVEFTGQLETFFEALISSYKNQDCNYIKRLMKNNRLIEFIDNVHLWIGEFGQEYYKKYELINIYDFHNKGGIITFCEGAFFGGKDSKRYDKWCQSNLQEN